MIFLGLVVHSLDGIPETHDRDYFIYLLDYGWHEPISKALKDNFDKMATLASKYKNSVVIRPSEGVDFSDEVFSWHQINGDDVEREGLLPAILITNRHPAIFKRRNLKSSIGEKEQDLKLMLIPLKKYCKTTEEVVSLIQKIFNQIKEGRDLSNFEIVKMKKKGNLGAPAHGIILDIGNGINGLTVNEFLKYFRD